MQAKFVYMLYISLLFLCSIYGYQLKPQPVAASVNPNIFAINTKETHVENINDVNTETENPITHHNLESISTSYNIGAYYYPWYSSDFHGGHYLREHLVPPQEPMLGKYNDRNEDVIAQHLTWSRYAGINFWAASWWGPGSREDITILNHILKHPKLGDFKIAILYETEGRTNGFTDYSKLNDDITYLAEHYFSHPNYLKIDGKPVLFIYLTRVLSSRGTLQKNLEAIRNAAKAANYSLYIIGDHAFGSPPNIPPNDMSLLDSVTNYDVYGSIGTTGYATKSKVDLYFANQTKWKNLADSVGVSFIPGISPGFNDRAVRDGHAPLSRKLDANQQFGSLFRIMLQKAKSITDNKIGRVIMITSWNEWHEDTQIEPVKMSPDTNLDDSKTGDSYTNSLSYEGYGERYLQILREEIMP